MALDVSQVPKIKGSHTAMKILGRQTSGFGVKGPRFRVQGLGFRVWGLGFRVWGLGFRVWG